MIPKNVFYERLEKHCKPCSEWDSVCLRGHALKSPKGCPMRLFEPYQSADYDEDKGRTVIPTGQGGCSSCGSKTPVAELPPMTWPQVMLNFAESIARWAMTGMPLASSEEHGRRYSTCRNCAWFKSYYCTDCKCVAYVKSNLQTEVCRKGFW